MGDGLDVRDYTQICAESSERAGVVVRSAGDCPMDLLMAWREEVLRDVFELPPDADMTEVMAANRARFEKDLADGDLVLCFAWPADDSGDPFVSEPVATGALCLQEELPSPDNPRGTCGYLMNIYTRPAWRRRGIARAVVAWLCAEARTRDLGKVYLEATPAAMPLYRSLGFTDMVDYLHL